MGLRRAMLLLNWPALACGFFNVLSAFGLILVTKLALHSLDFPFPATLALLHTGGIAAMLWFWTLFGMFKPRRVPLACALRVAAPHALTAVLALAALRHASLSVFQATRLAVAPAVFALERAHAALQRQRGTRRRRRHAFESSLFRLLYAVGASIIAIVVLLVVLDKRSSAVGIAVAIASMLATAVVQVHTLPTSRDASFTELQLQLYTKSCAAGLIAIACPFVDDYSPSSPTSIISYTFPEQYTLLIIFTSLLAFLSFVSMRASASRSTVTFFSVQSAAIAACSFTADQYFFNSRDGGHSLWFACVVTLLLATLFFSFLRDSQMRTVDRGRSGDHPVESSDEESQPLRAERIDMQRLPPVRQMPSPIASRGEGSASPASAVHRSLRAAMPRATSLNMTTAPRDETEMMPRPQRNQNSGLKNDFLYSC